MASLFKKLFAQKPAPRRFTNEQYETHYHHKVAGLERVLGTMHNFVKHAIIPFDMGGNVDMYFFGGIIPGTAFVTMEMIQPDGKGPVPSRIGTYEFVAFTKLPFGDMTIKEEWDKVERRMCWAFTDLGNYVKQYAIKPRDTAETPQKDLPNRCYIFDEYKHPQNKFMIGNQQHGLMLVLEVFPSEMEYAMQHGSDVVVNALKEKGHYPYCDLDRQPVF
jgi:hypothetical protein